MPCKVTSSLIRSVSWLCVGQNTRVQSLQIQSASYFSCSGINAVFEPEPTNGMAISVDFGVDFEIPYCFPISQINVLFSLISLSATFMYVVFHPTF